MRMTELEQRNDRRTREAKRNGTKNDGPHEIDEVSRKSVIHNWIAPHVFQNIKSMALNDVVYVWNARVTRDIYEVENQRTEDHDDSRYSCCNAYIHQDHAAFLFRNVTMQFEASRPGEKLTSSCVMEATLVDVR